MVHPVLLLGLVTFCLVTSGLALFVKNYVSPSCTLQPSSCHNLVPEEPVMAINCQFRRSYSRHRLAA
eukprot:3838454-Amphidinium_carterae.1